MFQRMTCPSESPLASEAPSGPTATAKMFPSAPAVVRPYSRPEATSQEIRVLPLVPAAISRPAAVNVMSAAAYRGGRATPPVVRRVAGSHAMICMVSADASVFPSALKARPTTDERWPVIGIPFPPRTSHNTIFPWTQRVPPHSSSCSTVRPHPPEASVLRSVGLNATLAWRFSVPS
jgi:hypothetical protein